MFKSKLLKNTKIAAIDKYGPNGKTLLSFLIRLITDNGSAIKDAINIVTMDMSKPKTSPITNNNFMSPPPRLSL